MVDAGLIGATAFAEGALSLSATRDKAKSERLELFRAACALGDKRSIHSVVYDWWAAIDAELFDGQLDPVLIVLGITEYSNCLGQCALIGDQSRIVLHQGLLEPSWKLIGGSMASMAKPRWGVYGAALGPTLLRDVLMHEMMHSAQPILFPDEERNPALDVHLSDSWVALCNMVSERLELGTWFPRYRRQKAPADRTGKRQNVWKAINADDCPEGLRMAARDELSSFPHQTRRPGYYRPELGNVSWADLHRALAAAEAMAGIKV